MSDEILYLYGNITKKDKDRRIVEGYISSGDVDLDGQIVDQKWLRGALPPWMADWGNIRAQHDPMKAIGKAQSVDLETQPGPYLTAKIVDDDAWKKCDEGVYNGFSVGIKSPVIVHDSGAPRGRIVGGKLIEISVVDRPANDAAKFVLVKSAGVGEWKDEQTGFVLSASPEPETTGLPVRYYSGQVPEGGLDITNMQSAELSKFLKPEDADKVLALREISKAITPEVIKREFSGGEREDLADSGAAMPDGSYPIENEKDLRNAIQAIGRAKDPGKAKSHIVSRAKALGKTDLLPEDWPGSTKKKDKEASAMKGAKKEAAAEAEAIAPQGLVVGEAEKAAGGIVHPSDGAHAHTHIHKFMGDTIDHSHEHMHGGDDVHEHMHCMNCAKDARACKCGATAMLTSTADMTKEAEAEAMEKTEEPTAPTGEATKAAGDFAAANTVTPPQRSGNIGSFQAIMQDAMARMEALANQTDPDRDGDIEFPNENEGLESKTESAEFRQIEAPAGTPVINPPPLSLTFSTVPDLVKALVADPTFMAAIRGEIQKGAGEFLTKTAAADTLNTVAEVSKLGESIAKGLSLVADRAEASAEELRTVRADVAKTVAELEKVKEMAAPPKGSLIAVEKGMLAGPDRFVEATKSGDLSSLNDVMQSLAGMTEQERMNFAATALKSMHG